MGMFGPNKDEVWRRLSQEIGGDFLDKGFWKGSKVQVHDGPWTVTLDTYTVQTGHAHVTYTRMRAPYVNPENFRFTLYRKNLFSGLGKFLGMQDIEVGHPEFDDAFIVKGTDEFRMRDFLDDARVRELLMAQPQIRLEVKDSEGWFGPSFPANVDELHFQVVGVLKDEARIKALFELFSAVLDRLVEIGSAYKEPPGVTL